LEVLVEVRLDGELAGKQAGVGLFDLSCLLRRDPRSTLEVLPLLKADRRRHEECGRQQNARHELVWIAEPSAEPPGSRESELLGHDAVAAERPLTGDA